MRDVAGLPEWDGVDVVVHLAALAGVAPSWHAPGAYAETNVTGTAAVLEWSRRMGVRRVVVASSSSVYGECDVPAAEDRELRPLSPYAETKAEAERRCHDAWPFEVVVVRPFSVYGPGQRPDMLLSRLLSGEALTLWPFVRDFTYIADIVAGLVACLDVELGEQVDTFNLGSGRPVTAKELLAALADVTGRDVDVSWGGARRGEPTCTWADPTKSRERLGLPEPTPLYDGLAAQVAASSSVGSAPSPQP